MCYLDGIASSLWEEAEVGVVRSSLSVNVSSLSLLAEEEQETEASQKCSLQAKAEAQEEPIELDVS